MAKVLNSSSYEATHFETSPLVLTKIKVAYMTTKNDIFKSKCPKT